MFWISVAVMALMAVKICSEIYRMSVFFIAVSSRMQRSCPRITLMRSTLVASRNGIDLEHFKNVNPRLLNSREPRIGIVANLRPVKNVNLFIRAAEEVVANCPGARFSIAGDGDCRRELEVLVENLRLQNIVRFCGVVADIPAFLSKVDVAIICSDSEGFSNAVIEYMAAGKVVIASRVGGNCEALEEDVSGLFFDPGAFHDLSTKILQVIGTPSQARTMAVNARTVAFEKYSNKVSSSSYERLYEHYFEQRTGSSVNQ